jgi:hypothetical protein
LKSDLAYAGFTPPNINLEPYYPASLVKTNENELDCTNP